ncbi:hypothetical protein PCE1_001566 [Barthelona sp. PCE]
MDLATAYMKSKSKLDEAFSFLHPTLLLPNDYECSFAPNEVNYKLYADFEQDYFEAHPDFIGKPTESIPSLSTLWEKKDRKLETLRVEQEKRKETKLQRKRSMKERLENLEFKKKSQKTEEQEEITLPSLLTQEDQDGKSGQRFTSRRGQKLQQLEDAYKKATQREATLKQKGGSDTAQGKSYEQKQNIDNILKKLDGEKVYDNVSKLKKALKKQRKKAGGRKKSKGF